MRRRSAVARLIAGTLVLGLVSQVQGSPGDVVTMAAPLLGADPPAGPALRDGDSSVATQTGALTYNFPIAVPPGRLGNQPSLALTYSSQAPLYGGVAAGWNLTIPEIQRDTSQGTLAKFADDPNDWASRRFVSTMAGSRPLIPVTEVVDDGQPFRAQNDTTYTRYERMPEGSDHQWVARSPDGMTYFFGDVHLAGPFGFDVDRVPLTRTMDAFGNLVEYRWNRDLATNELFIESIEYSRNVIASLPATARVTFFWNKGPHCGFEQPSGAAQSYRTGELEQQGGKRLEFIAAEAFDPVDPRNIFHTRVITLGYEDSCGNGSSGGRLLTSIQESAWGVDAPRVDLPAVTFEYGAAERTEWEFATHENWPSGSGGVAENALSFGRRFHRAARWPTVDAMFADLDGDGLVDRMLSTFEGETCGVEWWRNTGVGFEFGGRFSLPHLELGGALPQPEDCSLSSQFAILDNVPQGGECGAKDDGTQLAYRWLDVTGDGLTDLVTAIHHDGNTYDPNDGPVPRYSFNPGSYDTGEELVEWPACQDAPACRAVSESCHVRASEYCETDDGFEPCGFLRDSMQGCFDGADHVACEIPMRCDVHNPEACQATGRRPCDHPQIPHERCGLYPWLIYENQGDGRFPITPEIKLNPIPLESFNGDSPSGAGAYSSGEHALTDIDGDGQLDAIVIPSLKYRPPGDELPLSPLHYWYVWKGDGTGGFTADEDGQPFVWKVPARARPSFSETDRITNAPSDLDQIISSTGGLADFNGDGLQDYYWRRPNSSQVRVYWNNGHEFATDFEILDEVTEVSRTYLDVTEVDFTGDVIVEGFATQRTRLLDYDDDGRVDLLYSAFDETGWSAPEIRFNTGSELGSGYELTTNENLALATASVATGPDLRWQTDLELLDIDGDGVDELIQASADGSSLNKFRNPPTGHPARRMTAFHNGQGLHVAVEYAPLSDTDVVTSIAEIRKASPQTQWVVKSVITTDEFESTPATSTYEYVHPHWGPDDRGDWDFRGFETVRTTNPRGVVTEQLYRYDVDWSGRLAATLTFPAEASANPVTIADTEWRRYELFGGAIETFHPSITRNWTCANGQDVPTCRARVPMNDNNGLVRGEQVWTALTGSSGDPTPLLYAVTRTSHQLGDVPQEGDRYVDTSFAVISDETDYRVRGTASVSTVLHGSHETFEKSETRWDPKLLVVLEERVYFDETNFAATTRSYDMETGLVETITKPEQLSLPGAPHTLLKHDLQGFVTGTVNELGHVMLTDHEPGTGALLRTRGPNRYECGRDCTNFEERRTDVDGLGRSIATWVPFNNVDHYDVRQVTQTSYVDTPTGTTPTSITTRQLIEYDDSRWTEDKTELDGHGRPIRSTKFGGPAPAVTTFDYAQDGKLAAVTAPDPSSDGAFVTFTYSFDSIGRPTGMRRPDATGVDMAYNGLSETTREFVADLGGPAAVTEMVHDDFGRLTNVNEHLDEVGSVANTTYAYDPRDTIELVVDPEGVTTEMAHDFAGSRTQITRGDRTWTFGYDKNDNVIFEVSPPPLDELFVIDYTTSFVYDDLDRLASKSVAPRELSEDDGAVLGAGQTIYTYDQPGDGSNGIGQLHSATVGAVVTTTLGYDAEGNVTEERRSFDFAGVTGERRIRTTYGPAGSVREIDYGDGISTDAEATLARFGHDDRAQPVLVELKRATQAWETTAVLTRNVAGLVTSRVRAGSPTQTANWTYDRLGRVVRTVVRAPAIITDQQLTYWGSDDPRSLRHVGKGLTTRVFRFEYDKRHQLTSAATSAPRFSGAYEFTTGGRLHHVVVDAQAATGSDVRNRDVEYVYAGADAEMLTALRRPDGTEFASYNYDESGNVTSQVQQSALTTLTWDGEDQLRRSVMNGGSEEYFYDHAGARTGVVQRNTGGQITQVKYFQGPLEIWLGPSGSSTLRLAHCGAGTPIARVESSAVASTVELQYHGTLLSLLASVSTGGTVTSTFVYGPYGEVLQAGGSQLATHRRRFNDKQKDDLTGLYYYGARYFDSVAMVWKSADPAFRFAPDAAWTRPRRADLYTFDGGNPLRFVDPDGRNPISDAYDWAVDKAEGATKAITQGAVTKSKFSEVMGFLAETALKRAAPWLWYSAEAAKAINEARQKARDGTPGASDEEAEEEDPWEIFSDEDIDRPGSTSTNNPRKPPVAKGPGGGKKHNPGHKSAGISKREKKKQQKAAKKANADKAAREAEIKAMWENLSPDKKKLYTDYETFRKYQMGKKA